MNLKEALKSRILHLRAKDMLIVLNRPFHSFRGHHSEANPWSSFSLGIANVLPMSIFWNCARVGVFLFYDSHLSLLYSNRLSRTMSICINKEALGIEKIIDFTVLDLLIGDEAIN